MTPRIRAGLQVTYRNPAVSRRPHSGEPSGAAGLEVHAAPPVLAEENGRSAARRPMGISVPLWDRE